VSSGAALGPGLGLAALAVLAATLWHYARTVREVRVPRRPRAHQAVVAVALVAAGSALASGPGWLGGLAAGATLFAGGVFLVLMRLSALPSVAPAVAVGSAAPDFTAPDTEGSPFTLSAQRGRRILLKFFRGHW
jgi:hypothetical protein